MKVDESCGLLLEIISFATGSKTFIKLSSVDESLQFGRPFWLHFGQLLSPMMGLIAHEASCLIIWCVLGD